MIKKNYDINANYITINTNKNCLLKCAYCYENKPVNIEEDIKFWTEANCERVYKDINKNCNSKIISLELCKKYIDIILNYDFKNDKKLIFDFIGGDSLQYHELLDDIFTYICKNIQNTKYKYNWIFHISSNGVVLMSEKVRKFCEKWKENLHLGISIDGCPELHDLHRKTVSSNIYGYNGSFKYIEKIWPWYKKTFPCTSSSTKFTLTPKSYKYLYKSIKYLYEKMGISYIFFNRVMEQDVIDTENELHILSNEFDKINKYLADNHLNLYLFSYDFSRISESHTYDYMLNNDKEWSRCGFGRMPSLDLDGNVYSCFRMIPGFSHSSKKDFAIGNINKNDFNLDNYKSKEIYHNSFAVNMKIKDKCKKCPLFSSCPHCAADCIDESLKLIKTDSVCKYHIIETLSVIKYWNYISFLHKNLYKGFIVQNFFKKEDILNMLKILKE
ncbi:MAG: SPASM domain-containing protein [Elusimicrobiota bacterium]|jgi:uncharacterized protein|nr:SPASM domain-containing protein [Elusimicrobiota bacterium]